MVEHKTVDGIESKYCTKCMRWLPLESFHRATRCWDGLQTNCIECRNVMMRARPEAKKRSAHKYYVLHHERELAIRAAKRAAMDESEVQRDEQFKALFFAKLARRDGCLEWVGYIQQNGYGQVGFRGGLVSTHRAAWIIAYGAIPDGLFVCHHCDNRRCCNPEHLFLGTTQDNMDDMVSKGRHGGSSGEAHPKAKLTKARVNEIRRRYADENILQGELANEYGVAKPTVAALLLNRSWYDPDYTPLPKRIKMSGPNNSKIKGDNGD